MAEAGRTRIELCGRLSVELAGRRVEDALPGPQGRLVFAYLALERSRPTSRDALIDLLWPATPPADPDEALSALLSKLRRALGAEVLEGRAELTLALPAEAWIDLEAARQAADRSDSALARSDPAAAWQDAQDALEVARRGFFARHDSPWVEERRREIEELRLRCLECVAASGVSLGGSKLSAAERAARAMIESAPFRETGYRLLMETLAARGNTAEALRSYDELRVLLRDELGTSPGAALKGLHERLLAGEDERESPTAVPEASPATDAPPDAPPAREERKLVTVLFAELVPARAQKLDPERLRAALASYQDRIRGELEPLGATIERPRGAVMTAVFGAAPTHEDDPQRAVSGALRVCELVRELNEQPDEVDFDARLAVATGEALVATDESAGASERIVTGDVLATAFHLQQFAPSGGVLVDEPTHRSTRDRFDYDQLDPVTLEEGRDAVAIWRATAVRGGLTERMKHGAPTRFVGRDHELALLESLYRAAAGEGRPRLVTILGQAGVGKTRLTDEFVVRIGAGDSEVAVHRGRCLPYGEGIVYWALREVLWQVADIQLDDTAAAAGEKLRLLVRGLLGEAGVEPADAERVLFALAISSGISLPDNPLEGLSPDSIAEEVGLAWPRLLSALATDRPVAVVMEDLHWAESPLLDMVEHIVSRSQGNLLIIATARPEFAETRPGWTSRPRMSQIGLEPLTEEQSRELLDELLPGMGQDLRDKVAGVAEGNPFFAEEIVRHLVDEGALAPAEQDRTSALPDGEIAIPPTVRAVLAARIDALPDAEKHVLQDAAVVGRTFWVTTLESMRADASIRSTLKSVEEKGLVATRPGSSLPGQTELWFRHALTREVAYASIPRAGRPLAHANVAAWLERLTGDRRDEFIDLLAHHYEAAATPDDAGLAWPADSPEREEIRRRAVEALLAAGRAAYKHVALDQAAGYASRALALAGSESERLAGLELRARALHGAIRADEAFSAYVDAVEIARKLGDNASASRLVAHAALLCSRYGGAFSGEAWRARATKLVEQVLGGRDDSVSFEAGALLVWRGSMARRFGSARDRGTARRDAERAIEIAEEIDSPFLLAYALEGLWNLTLQEGVCEQAEMGERMLRLGETMTDRVEAHETLVAAALALARGGRHEDAEAVADEVTGRAVHLSPHRRLHAACAQASCLVPRGRLEKLRDVTADVLDLVLEEGGRTCPYGGLALAAHAVALFEAGDGAAARAAELLDVAGPPRSLRYGAVEIARPLIGLEETRRMLDSMEGARDTIAAIGSLRAELQLCALSGEWGRLDELIAEARELSGPACAPSLGLIADWSESMRLASEGSQEEALEQATRAASGLEHCGERYVAARLLVDLLPRLDSSAAQALGEQTGEKLESMGALGSAAEARQAVKPSA